ncbi:hypothetical protein B1813_09630 [Saccharomonospora piscinae]|uniref:Plasmid replication, integration and excision activator n=1 Tax=Saccharomonospora piscinae TaxID=687388 RepID=A0A1V9A5X8_SACPI|nr:hypothetical protein [Saccharomonospora piscinae]OQO92450.1 hypothetical protein B1813_09630 [Saccharomonospora piscinae]
MAIPKGFRFPIEFDEAFPQGLVMVGEVSPDTEFQSREDKAMGKPARQRVDEESGLLRWKVTVTDPSESNAKRASFEVTLVAKVQPVPLTSEALPGMRPIELEGLTAEPKVAGNGEFKYQSYVYRATGFKAPAASAGNTRSGKGSASSAPGSEGESSAKAA